MHCQTSKRMQGFLLQASWVLKFRTVEQSTTLYEEMYTYFKRIYNINIYITTTPKSTDLANYQSKNGYSTSLYGIIPARRQQWHLAGCKPLQLVASLFMCKAREGCEGHKGRFDPTNDFCCSSGLFEVLKLHHNIIKDAGVFKLPHQYQHAMETTLVAGNGSVCDGIV